MNGTIRVDALVAEIGSTTTVMNAFDRLETREARFLGQGLAKTSVEDGDVSIGLDLAREDLCQRLGCSAIESGVILATSSAAGGLRVSCHGLVYDMTVRAAREACLGSGAVLKMVTAGKLRRSDLKRIREIMPNMIFLAGGTDYGERETALHNAELLMQNFSELPLIYAGNVANQEEISQIAADFGCKLYLSENVYPTLDRLNIEGARKLIHKVFEENIVTSPGMEKIRERVDGQIMPTPGAVMEAAMLARNLLGDLLVVDIGGATTDVHSVCENNPAFEAKLSRAEPFAKRTVEGDLGVYVNRGQIVERFSEEERRQLIPDADYYLREAEKIPRDAAEVHFVEQLCAKALQIALERHAGHWTELYSALGMTRFIDGKDLSLIKFVLGTGGALTRLPAGAQILETGFARPPKKLLLPAEVPMILLDRHYIMASLGVLSRRWPRAAETLLLNSLGCGNNERMA